MMLRRIRKGEYLKGEHNFVYFKITMMQLGSK